MSITQTRQSVISRRTMLGGAAALGVGSAFVGSEITQATAAQAAAAQVPVAQAATPSRLQVGFSVNSGILWEDAASRARSLDAIVSMGATSIRMDLAWHWIEKRQAQFDWAPFDAIVDEALQRGLTVLGVLTGAPSWAAYGRSTNPATRPASTTTWVKFVQAAAEHYRDRIFAYEIWNEPNAREYFAPDPHPVFYASMVRSAAAAIKAADPDALVICAALGPAPAGFDGLMPALDFFDQMLAAGIGRSVDAVSFHPYDDQTLAQGAFWDHTAMRTVTEMHRRLRAKGLGAMKIWATEYGAPSEIGEARQAELVTTGMSMWAELGVVGPMYLHHHKDQYAGDSFGVMQSNHTPKQAAYGVQATLGAGVPERAEAAVFRQNADAALGSPTTPVYVVAGGLAQDHQLGVRFRNGSAYWSSTPEAGDLLRRSNLLPKSATVNGRQWVDVGYPSQVFTKAGLGSHFVVGEYLAIHTDAVGFPTAGAVEAVVDGMPGTSQTFERATMTWREGRGAAITWR